MVLVLFLAVLRGRAYSTHNARGGGGGVRAIQSIDKENIDQRFYYLLIINIDNNDPLVS